LADLIACHFFGHTNSKWVRWQNYTNDESMKIKVPNLVRFGT